MSWTVNWHWCPRASATTEELGYFLPWAPGWLHLFWRGSFSTSVPNTGQTWPLISLTPLHSPDFSSQESEESLWGLSPALSSQPGSPLPTVYLPNSREILSAPPSPNGTSTPAFNKRPAQSHSFRREKPSYCYHQRVWVMDGGRSLD